MKPTNRAAASALTAICLAALLLAGSSCGDDDDDDPTAGPTSGTTGVEAVDRVLAALDSGDQAGVAALLQFTKIKCAANPQGLGAPPKCPPGVADGSPVEAFLMGNCEGTWVLKDQQQSAVDFIRQRHSSRETIFAVVNAAPSQSSVDEGGLPVAKYTVIYGSRAQQDSWYVSIDDGLVSAFNGCAQPPEVLAERRDTSKANGGFILAPKP